MNEEEKPQAIEGEIVKTVPLKRLTKHDENIVLVLETAFHNGYNITEACQYADISRETYYNWLEDDDIFSYRMSVAQSALNRKAKSNVATAIRDGDPGISLRVLMLKDPEYKPKMQQDTDPNVAEALNQLRGVLDAISQYDASGQSSTTDTASVADVVETNPSDIS